MSIKQINDTTFSADGLGDVKPVVAIGGSVTDKFIPNVNNSFHDDEFFFNLNAVDDSVSDESATENNGVISQSINNETHEYYIDDSGRLKWDKLFSSCPDSMRVRFKVKKSAGIKFEYQPELTAEEIADGCERPDDIVGSYAVYCDKANNKYKTGKLCHIPRPFVIDASGNREWCVMTYEEISDTEGMLYIDLPELFMQSAAYPVRLDPTIGYTTAGGSSWTKANFLAACRATSSAAGTVNPGNIYANIRDKTNDYIRCGLYADNSDTPVGGSKISSAESEITINGTLPGWQSGAVTVSGGISASTQYWLAIHMSSCAIAYDSAATNVYYSTVTYNNGVNGLPSTYPTSSAATRILSVYLDYTESGGATSNSYYYQQQQM